MFIWIVAMWDDTLPIVYIVVNNKCINSQNVLDMTSWYSLTAYLGKFKNKHELL